ncbi:cell division ATP-binding protein FtsE [Aestuariibius insulae]|uniref:cell division ATP-binding protein FtsE n=1 Tax=Aestuariibius insulae TaxID=2058287 RepID=UPI00345E5A32
MIELENIAYGYGGRVLFAGVSLTLEPGSFHILTGASGTGKTTLIRLCYGDLTPTEGAVQLFGRDLAGMDRDRLALSRRRIGVVHQEARFLDHLPLRDNVALPLAMADRMGGEEEAQLGDLLAWVGLTQQQDQRPPELSGGERQRAALARAVIMSPEIVLADEPTGNIDWEMSERLLQLLIELNRSGKAVLIATHDLALIRQAKSAVDARILRLKDGQLDMAGAAL